MTYKFNKTRTAVPVKKLQPHAMQEQLAGVITLPKFYLDGMRGYGHIEIPVVTKDYKVLTHYADVMAAKELGIPYIEVEVVDVDDKYIPQYLLFTNLFQQKQYAAMSIAIDYVLEYFKTDTGKDWADSIPGDKEKKLGYIFGTGTSTIKRFLSIAKHHRDSLNLVQEGNMTWDELKKMIAAPEPVVTGTSSSQSDIEPESVIAISASQEDVESSDIEDKQPGISDCEYEETIADTVEIVAPDEPVAPDDKTGTAINDAVSITANPASYEFLDATYTLLDGRTIKITTTDNGKELSIDGKKVNATYNYLHDLGDGRNTEYYSTVFMADNMGKCSFQIYFDNPKKLFSK